MGRKNIKYPKDDEVKLRDTIRKLKVQISRLRKENKVLREELENIMKPVRVRKEHREKKGLKKMTRDEWRENFVKEHKPLIKKRLKEIKDEK